MIPIATWAAHHIKPSAIATEWWLLTGITSADVVQVLHPKGAADYASSLICKAGKQNARNGIAPTFNTATGWEFNGTTQYIDSQIVPINNGTWSVFVRYSDSANATTNNYLIGVSQNSNLNITRCFILVRPGSSQIVTAFGDRFKTYYTAPTSGVVGFSGEEGYLNGVAFGTAAIFNDVQLADRTLYIGATNSNNIAGSFFSGKIQAKVIYKKTLTQAQITQLTAAMAAL